MKLNEAMLMLMRETNNFFALTSESGEYGIKDGAIALQGEYLPNQWIAISGSVLNDGIYRVKSAAAGMHELSNGSDDETPAQDEAAFAGVVYGLGAPRGFVSLAEEVGAFCEGAGKPTAYISEMVVGLHQWSRGLKEDGTPIGWAQVFADRLAPFRRIFAQISI